MKIKKLQDRMNEALAEFDGRKYPATKSSLSEYHHWKTDTIDAVIEATPGADFLGVGCWKVTADIYDGPGGLKVAGEDVAEITADLKPDARYKWGNGPGTVKSIRVAFRPELLDLTIEEARLFLLKEEKEKRLTYYKKERARLARELDETAAKIAEIEAVEIEEVST